MSRERNVLVVDDEIRITEILKLYLQKGGYNVYTAADGKKALEIADSHIPDVIISDLMMPGIDGIELCKIMKTESQYGNPYFIMLTARSTVDSKVQGLKIGADDYITKPFNAKEVVARVSSAMRIKDLQNEIMEKNIVLERFKQEMEKELFLAGKFQSSLVPEGGDTGSGVKLNYKYIPTIHVGGDIFDVKHTSSGKTAFFIADVAGHGIVAALISSMIKLSFVQAIVESDTPSDIAKKINNDLINTTADEHFASMFLGCYDSDLNQLSYVRAGHPAPALIKSDGHVDSLDADGFLIGIMKDINLEMKSVKLHQGDRIILFTDGITEAESPEGVQYEMERLLKCLKESSGDFPNELYEDVKDWTNNNFDDDVTVIEIEVT